MKTYDRPSSIAQIGIWLVRMSLGCTGQLIGKTTPRNWGYITAYHGSPVTLLQLPVIFYPVPTNGWWQLELYQNPCSLLFGQEIKALYPDDEASPVLGILVDYVDKCFSETTL